MTTILMPCHELERRIPDDHYKEEYEAAKLQGFRVVLFDFDLFVKDSELILKDNEPVDVNVTGNDSFIGPMIYRGYMLKDNQYELLYKWLQPRYKLINSPKEYNQCHYFPEVYEYVKDHTAKSVWITDINLVNVKKALNQLNTKLIFMKDFVKSAKESADFALLESKNAIYWLDVIRSFIEYRGKLFNKGIVLKEWIESKRYGINTNEWRCVFLNTKLVSITQNSNLVDAPKPNIDWLFPIISKIPSNFFTVDLIELEDGSYSIIETGDGQVSGPTPGQNMIEYYFKLNEYTHNQ